MAHTRYQAVHRCTKCDRETERVDLTVKKVEFREMGSRAKTVRSRVVDWLCPECLVKDEVWNLPAFDERRSTPVAPTAPPVLPAQMEIDYDGGW